CCNSYCGVEFGGVLLRALKLRGGWRLASHELMGIMASVISHLTSLPRAGMRSEEMENLLSMAGCSALSPFMCIQCLLKLPADPQHRQNGDIFHGPPCSESTLQQCD
ncbi:unnamed protein product, partial [Bubo scandiacus]